MKTELEGSLSFLNTNGIKLRIFVYYKVAGLANNAGNSLVIAVFSRGDFIFIVFVPEYMIPVDWYPSDGLSQPNAEASIPWVLQNNISSLCRNIKGQKQSSKFIGLYGLLDKNLDSFSSSGWEWNDAKDVGCSL